MMQLKFKKIVLHNFFCFVHEEVELEDMGYTIVTGINNHKTDNAVSNGSGKSSIFNAICYALTGETAQGLSNNVENIFSDANDCWVELSLSINNDDFIIRRIKTPKSDLKIYINGVDKSGKGIKESNKKLSEYLPDLTSTFLGSIIILGQGLPSRFTEGHPGYRKEKLERLTKSDFMIQSIRSKLDERQDELKLQLRRHEDLLVENKTQLDIYNSQLSNYNNELLKYNKYLNEDLDEIIKSTHLKIDECLHNKTNYNSTRLDILNKIENINKNIAEYNNNYNSVLSEELVNCDKAKESLNEKVVSLSSQIMCLQSEITKLDNVSDICPTCKQKLLYVKKVDTTKLKEELSEKNKDLAELNKELESVKLSAINIRTAIEKKKSEDLLLFNNDLNRLKKDLLECDNNLNICDKDYQSFLQEESVLNNYKENFDRINNSINRTKELINKLNDDSIKLNESILNDNEHLKVIQNLITLTKKEFRGVLLENVINYINNKVKQYSKEVFDQELLSFTLNDNYIDILYDNKYYEALSGGEKQKVDIIIQLALRDLLSNQFGIHSNILVLDEIFDSLDAVGCQKIIDLISKINDIESIFIISHHLNGLQISYDSEIVVEKNENNISTISIH